MKTRQFITILAVVIIGFIYLGVKVNNMQDYLTNIDNNVATVDGRLVWDVIPKLD